MLSRAGSDANTHLRRTKSAASVKQRRQDPLIQMPVDAERARVHARTAAHIAMGRANERASIEIRRSTDLARCDANAGRPANREAACSQPIHFSPASELRRQRSILQSKGSSIVPSSQNPTQNPFFDLSQYTVPPPSDFVVTGYGSEPSSYRKIRKVKSVLTPHKRAESMHNMSSCSPYSTRTLRSMKSSLGDAERGLRIGLRRSISFLRGSSGNLSKASNRAESQTKLHDEAIQIAQEQFYNDLEQQRLRQKPPFFSTKTRQPQKAFRKTVRSNRTSNIGDGVQGESQDASIFMPESKSRSISASLRDKVKRIFGRSGSNKDRLPTQQLDASRPHFRDYIDGTGMESALDQYFVGTDDATPCGSLYIPSDEGHDSLEDLDQVCTTLGSAQSMDDLHSNTSRSRVSSWTNSTTTQANSVAARGITPLERKRLSIIKEDGGPHQPSSSAGRHVGGIEAFRKPLPSQSAYGEPGPPLDSQRIYSALMKRIDQEQADAESSRSIGTPVDEEADTVPSSAQSYETAPTVRAEASLHTMAPDNEHRQSRIGSSSWQEDSGMTPQEIAQHHENIERRKAQLAEQEQKWFLFPTPNRSNPQTPTSFKAASTAQKENSTTSQSESGSVIVNRNTDSDDRVRGNFALSSDSIYSRTTGGHPDPQILSEQRSAEDTDESPPVDGMGITTGTRLARYPRPTPSLVQLRRALSSERGGWRGLMEKEMSTLDRRRSRASTSHHREHAKIDGDDTAVGSGSGRASASKGVGPELGRRGSPKTVRIVEDNQTTVIPLARKSSITNHRFPLLDLKEVPVNSTPKPTVSQVQRASMIEVIDENEKLGGANTARKSSRPFRGTRSQVSMKYKAKDENSPPVSTPGRLQVLGHEYCGTASFASPTEITPTPKQRHISQMNMANWGQFGRNITNDSDRDLSRLSKPFDMDIPNGNRPFDSAYLGTEQSYGKGGKVGRLSVALSAAAGRPGDSSDDGNESGDTALPKVEKKSATRDVRRNMTSKRMVSNFLRIRRKNYPAKDEADDTISGSSPAFV